MVDRPERNLRTTGADLDDVRNDGSIRWVPSGTWHHACSTAEAPGGTSSDRHMDSRGCRSIHSGSVPGHTSILVSDAVQVRHARSTHPVAASEACSSQCRFAMQACSAGSQCRLQLVEIQSPRKINHTYHARLHHATALSPNPTLTDEDDT